MRVDHILKAAIAYTHIVKTAMFVHNVSSGSDSSPMVIAYRDKIWILDLKQIFDNKLDDQRVKAVFDDIEDALGLPSTGYEIDNFPDLLEYIREYRYDFLIGYIDKARRRLFLDTPTGLMLSPSNSVLVKKVVETLKLRAVDTEEMEDQKKSYTKQRLLGRIPDVLYHGTSTKYVWKILRQGLRGGESPTNYKEIQHDKEVFLTALFSTAAYHALHTAREVGGRPLILSFQIPDPALIIPDYDVDVQTSQTYWAGRKDTHIPDESSSDKLTREFGIVGYKGRIPASFIRGAWLDIDDDEYTQNWKKVPLKRLEWWLDMYG